MVELRPSTPPPAKSNSGIVFIVGGLVVAVGILAYVLTDGTMFGSRPDASSGVTIENNTTAPAAAPTSPTVVDAPATAAPQATTAPDVATPAPAAPVKP